MRKLVSVLLCLALGIVLLLPVQAASAGSFLFQTYDVQGQFLSCYGKQLPDDGTLTVSYSSEKVEDAQISTISKEETPVTVYCLVDSATSLSDIMIQQEQECLEALSACLRSADSMVISTIDETFQESQLLENETARANAIKGIHRGSWVTNLYSGMDQALDSLKTNTTFHTNRVLVILTDGHDEGKTNVKTEALLEKIHAGKLPVYTVLLGGEKRVATTAEIETMEQLSQQSMGGRLCRLPGGEMSAKDAANTIWDSIEGGSVITLNASSLPNQADVQLLVRYDTSDTRYEDTILIRAVDLPVSALTAETGETGETEGLEEDAEDEEKSLTGVLIAAGIGTFAVLAVILILVLRKHGKAADQNREKIGTEFNAEIGIEPKNEIEYNLEENFIPDIPGSTEPAAGSCHVHMVAILHPEITCDFSLAENGEITLGRDKRAAILLNGKDPKLSGSHLGLLWDGKYLLVCDKHSTNGTFINGAPCTDALWYKVENGSVIRAGSNDYRVMYKVDSDNGGRR